METLIVCDEEWSALFNYDRQKIIDYWTVYFWDINLRFSTLAFRTSFVITGVIFSRTKNDQPFIENARGPDGRASYQRIHENFRKWSFQEHNSLPKFDIALVVTNTAMEENNEGGHGHSTLRGACSVDHSSQEFEGVGVFSDKGGWESVMEGAHEIAHLLGARDDSEERNCNESGYIMSEGEDAKRFFSTCTERAIQDFVRSSQASCLRRQDQTGDLPMNPTFTSALAPSMDDQCKIRLGSSDATVFPGAETDCVQLNCRASNGDRVTLKEPVDNSICGAGNGTRCFRGRCRKEGSLAWNAGQGRCMRAGNTFDQRRPALSMAAMDECSRDRSPVQRFVLTQGFRGLLLAAPFSTRDGTRQGERCLYTGNADGQYMWTERCNPNCPSFAWELEAVENGYLLRHAYFKLCARAEGGLIRMRENCDASNDPSLIWQFRSENE